jgi:hypothetical protein
MTTRINLSPPLLIPSRGTNNIRISGMDKDTHTLPHTHTHPTPYTYIVLPYTIHTYPPPPHPTPHKQKRKFRVSVKNKVSLQQHIRKHHRDSRDNVVSFATGSKIASTLGGFLRPFFFTL